MSDPLAHARRIVVKIGSALLVDGDALRRDWLKSLCGDVAALRREGKATLPVRLGVEIATNPFLRALDAPSLGRLRTAKDNFK